MIRAPRRAIRAARFCRRYSSRTTRRSGKRWPERLGEKKVRPEAHSQALHPHVSHEIVSRAPWKKIAIGWSVLPEPVRRALAQDLAPYRELLDPLAPRLVANAGTGGHANRPLRGDGHFGIDDVFGPVTLAGGDVAGQRKVSQGGESNIVRSADAGFEQAAAPHRNAVIAAEIMDAPRRSKSTHAAQLHINDAAGAQRDGGLGVLFAVDALVEADRRLESALQFHMAPDVVPAERLFDHHQVVGV